MFVVSRVEPHVLSPFTGPTQLFQIPSTEYIMIAPAENFSRERKRCSLVLLSWQMRSAEPLCSQVLSVVIYTRLHRWLQTNPWSTKLSRHLRICQLMESWGCLLHPVFAAALFWLIPASAVWHYTHIFVQINLSRSKPQLFTETMWYMWKEVNWIKVSHVFEEYRVIVSGWRFTFPAKRNGWKREMRSWINK